MHNQFYGFAEEPFGLTPDPRFFFLTENHKEIIDSLIYRIGEKDGLILLTGESGLGKTTLIRQLLPMLPPNITAIPIFQPTKTFSELLEFILQQLNLPLEERNKSFMVSQFNDYLYHKSAQDEALAIIVDEAQELSNEVMEELRLLWNPDPRRPRRLKEVFVGQPRIEEKLNSMELRPLNQRIAIRHRLRPLTEEESCHYIEHRFNKVGKSASEIFTQEAISLICSNAKGIPRIINMVCYLSLSAGYALAKRKIDSAIVEEVFWILDKQNPSKWLKIKNSIIASTDRLGKSPLTTKISVLLLVYSFFAWTIFLFLSLK
jgi:general secretion pathway protein A